MAEEKFSYEKAQFEEVPCNLCGASSFFILAKSAAGNRNARTCLCKKCGLIYISPRMMRECYDKYYADFYREDRERTKGFRDKGGMLEKNFELGRKFGRGLAKKVFPFIESGSVIDVGSSTGGVLFGLREKIPELKITGVEPSDEESSFAVLKGIPTERFLFEDFILGPGRPTSLTGISAILCVRSLNHLLDPRKFFSWSHDVLRQGGHLVLHVKNFRFQARRAGSVEAGAQIDHPYMFTPEVLCRFVESVGFNVVSLEDDERKTSDEINTQIQDGLSKHHILLIAEKPKTNVGFPRETEIRRTGFLVSKLYFQLSQPYLKAHYLTSYSRYSRPFRKLVHGLKLH